MKFTRFFFLLSLAVFVTTDGYGQEAPAEPSYRKDYQIGDEGPAGGIVFYDKGSLDDGWRYLEAAKEDLGKAPWGSDKAMSALDMLVLAKKLITPAERVGAGKQNTQRLVKSGAMAAMLCAAYRGGDFSDWFLPSKDELNLMYITWSDSTILLIGKMSTGLPRFTATVCLT